MKSWKKPTQQTIDHALSRLVREPDRRFFYGKLMNPLWLPLLVERGVYESPPLEADLGDGSVHFPVWPELNYLANIAKLDPDGVVEVIKKLPNTNNKQVHWQIVEIAIQLPGESSVQLAEEIAAIIEAGPSFAGTSYQELLEHWSRDGWYVEAMELARILLTFDPDPHVQRKRTEWLTNERYATDFLDPSGRLDEWSFKRVAHFCVDRLASEIPYDVALMLLDVSQDMLSKRQLRDPEDLEKWDDHSSIWCRRLDNGFAERDPADVLLIKAFAASGERLFRIEASDRVKFASILARKRWTVMIRLRHHLLSTNPGDWSKQLIRNAILDDMDLGETSLGYEDQKLIRAACEWFGRELFSEDEWNLINSRILDGPSKERYQKFLGPAFAEELYVERQRYFHRHQLNPFKAALSASELDYLSQLETDAEAPITDDDYSPFGEIKTAWIQEKSPYDLEALLGMTDHELLQLINVWDAERPDPAVWSENISFDGFARAFEELIESWVTTAPHRLEFWVTNFEQIRRPIFGGALIRAFQNRFKQDAFDHFDWCFAMCQSVLEHEDSAPSRQAPANNSNGTADSWHDARRVVCDVVDQLFDQGKNPPIEMRPYIGSLLRKLCIQFDWRLDGDHPVLLGREDQFSEAINNVRSRALMKLIDFGCWLKRHDLENFGDQVEPTLNSRLLSHDSPRLTLPERAALGMYAGKLIWLLPCWFEKSRALLFDQNDLDAWAETFENFVRGNQPHASYWPVMQKEYEFAVENFRALRRVSDSIGDARNSLGTHLFAYYMWGKFPASGIPTLIRRYFQLSNQHGHELNRLFASIGESFATSSSQLDQGGWAKVDQFLAWRTHEGSTTELAEFWRWLKATGPTEGWKIDWCERVFDSIDFNSLNGFAAQLFLEWFAEVLEFDPDRVVACFSRLVATSQSGVHHLNGEHLKLLISAGLASNDEKVVTIGKRARDALLRKGRLDLLELGAP